MIGQLRAAGWQLHGDSTERRLLAAVAKAVAGGQAATIRALANCSFNFAGHTAALAAAVASAIRSGEADVIAALNTAKPRPMYQHILPKLSRAIVDAAEAGHGDVLRELRLGGLGLPEPLRQEAEEAAAGKGSLDALEELARGRRGVTTEQKLALAGKTLMARGRRQETRYADLRVSVTAAKAGVCFVPRNYR